MFCFRLFALLFIGYGALCLFLPNLLWRFTVRKKQQTPRERWMRLTMLGGLFSLGLGLFLLVVG